MKYVVEYECQNCEKKCTFTFQEEGVRDFVDFDFCIFKEAQDADWHYKSTKVT